MRYGSDKSEGSPWGDRLGGAAAGASAVVVGQKIHAANRKANWALGIGVVLTALAAVSSSDLNADMTTAQGLATQAQAMPIVAPLSASLTTLSDEVQRIRAHLILQDNLMAKISYDANLFAFGGTPTQQNAPVQSGAITPTAVAASTSSNGLIIVAVAALVIVLAVAL